MSRSTQVQRPQTGHRPPDLRDRRRRRLHRADVHGVERHALGHAGSRSRCCSRSASSGILAPLTGQLGDRFDRRTVMIDLGVDRCRRVLRDGVRRRAEPLIGLAFVSAMAESPFWSASRAAIPNLVEREEDIAWANSLLGLGRNAGIMIGPVIGGVLLDRARRARGSSRSTPSTFVVSVAADDVRPRATIAGARRPPRRRSTRGSRPGCGSSGTSRSLRAHVDRLARVPAGARAWAWSPTRRSPSTSARARSASGC